MLDNPDTQHVFADPILAVDDWCQMHQLIPINHMLALFQRTYMLIEQTLEKVLVLAVPMQ
jgi:hypothetical protein